MSLVNSAFGPPPIATPLNAQGPDEHGIPYDQRSAQGGTPSGGLNPAWGQWFSHLHDKPGDLNPSPSVGGAPTQYGSPTAVNASQLLGNFLGNHLSLPMFGAKGDARTVSDGSMSSTVNPTHLSSASANFVAADVGKKVYVAGAGAAGATLTGTVASISSTTIAVLSASASTTVSSAALMLGTDDTAAFTGAITAISAIGGGKVLIPDSFAGLVTSTVAFPFGIPMIIEGHGKGSVIMGTGFNLVRLKTIGHGLERLKIFDPIGNSSTVGVFIYGGTPSFPDANQIYLNDIQVFGNASLISGGHSAGLGVGIQLQDSVNVTFQKVTCQYFREGMNLVGSFNTAVRLNMVTLFNHGDVGLNFSTTGDMTATHCDFEGCTNAGILANSQNLVVIASHFESNGNNVEIANGQFFSFGNTYAGGNIQIDSGAWFVSFVDQLAEVTLLNNSMGGSGFPGAQFFFPLLGPTINPASTGWSKLDNGQGIFQFLAAVSGSPIAFAFQGATSYTFDNPIIAHAMTLLAALTAQGASFAGAVTMASTLTAHSIQTPVLQGKATTVNPINLAVETGTSANNALVVTLTDANGAAVALADNAQMIATITHTLHAGANTLSLNGGSALPILRALDGGNLTQAWSASRMIFINVSNAFWFLLGAQ